MDTLTAPAVAPTKPAHAGLIDARLVEITPVAKDTNLYTFRRVEGGALPPYKPGAHIDLHLPNGMIRQFSLCAPNTDPDSYVVGIKRDAQSRGGSRYIYDEMKVGHDIKISAPRNNFPLVENADHIVLVAGGIGITPIWCMAQQLTALGRSWKLYYSCRSRAEMAFLDTLEKFDPDFRHLHFDEEADGKVLDLAAVIAAAPPERALLLLRPQRDAQGL